jgi:peptidoglycan hydrolase-like protein with peptidoglycan-binding domain
MRPEESFIGQPVRSLQTMLRILAEQDPTHPSVVPDGIYGPQTVSAVSEFQRRHGLPVTGVTDQDTWEAITAAHETARISIDAAQPVEIILNPNQIIRRGERHPAVPLAQAMLIILAEAYSSISRPSVTGILDDPTADSLSSFQMLSSLPMTGNLDKRTWKHLSLHYPLAANLGTLPGEQAGLPWRY